MSMSSFRDRRVIVMGLGRFGGGVGVTRWLAEQGAQVVVTDLADEIQLGQSINQLQGLPIEYHLGGHRESDLEGANLLVVNPAVDKSHSHFVRQAVARGVPLTSEVNLFFERCSAKVIGITGSIGKSTTTAMIFDVLYAHLKQLKGSPDNVWLGGNIGGSLLLELPRISPNDYVVLELSSFQLDDLGCLGQSPHIAVLTNLAPHHLDRHGGFHDYLQAKMNIFRWQTLNDFAVISEQAWALLQEHGFTLRDQRLTIFGGAEELAGHLQVLGKHQLHNAAAAIRVCRLLGLPVEVVKEELKQFKGLPHRLEKVREYEGVTYYDDSKSTIPQATITVLEAFESKVILLAGGADKQVSFEELAEETCKKARVVIAFGEARAKLASGIRRLGDRRVIPAIKSVQDFYDGVNLARKLAKPGEVVLLSPGCPSYDQFANYEERGDRFKDIVNGWI